MIDGAFPRELQAHVDENAAIAVLLADRRGPAHILIDVGAHTGSSAQHFHDLGWTIHCFEPDATNRGRLANRFKGAGNVTIDPRAVSDRPATGVAFYTSPESSGISGLSAFRESHTESARVDVTTVADIVADRRIRRVDFLKIDVEGFDFAVLQGVPWDRVKPDVVAAEFEDTKAVAAGVPAEDIAAFLRGHGYAVYLSVWHPTLRYGIRHHWAGVVASPGPAVAADAWGNILAFRADPGFDAVKGALLRVATFGGAPAGTIRKPGLRARAAGWLLQLPPVYRLARRLFGRR